MHVDHTIFPYVKNFSKWNVRKKIVNFDLQLKLLLLDLQGESHLWQENQLPSSLTTRQAHSLLLRSGVWSRKLASMPRGQTGFKRWARQETHWGKPIKEWLHYFLLSEHLPWLLFWAPPKKKKQKKPKSTSNQY